MSYYVIGFIGFFIFVLGGLFGVSIMYFLMKNEVDEAFMDGMFEAKYQFEQQNKPKGEESVRLQLLSALRNEAPHDDY